jgi:short-subunit dehydrogenase
MRHAIVTGASSGIGEAIARELVAAGWQVTMVARRRDRLEAIAAELGPAAEVVVADLCAIEDLRSWLASLGKPIDLLVNNAGTVAVGPFVDIDPADARRVFDLDLIVPLALCRAALPEMLARGAGTIVNVASTGALGPSPGMVDYCAAKAGLGAASEALRGELRGTGVQVVTVYPGPTDTPMLRTATAGYPDVRAVRSLPSGTPAALARRIRRAVERHRARVIYPRVYTFFRYFPSVVRRLLDRFTPPPLPASAGSDRR